MLDLAHVAAFLERAALDLRVSILESAALIPKIGITLDNCCCRSPIGTWGCFATVHYVFLRLVPAFSSLLQAREVARLATAPKPNVGAPRCRWKRGGILGRLSRPLALQPALPAGHTARTRGIPRRVAVLDSRHKARDVGEAQTTVTRSAGVRQARRVTGAAALTSNRARIVSFIVSHRISNRTVSISTIHPQIWRAVWPSAKLRCVQADNRTGSFDTKRYCSDSH